MLAPCKRHLYRATLSIVLAISVFALLVGATNAQSPDPGPAVPQSPAYDEEEAQVAGPYYGK